MLQIYIKTKNDEWKLLDLFDDESIPLEFKLMDLTELEKAFSLISEDFAVPASSNNDLIFDYFFDTNIANQKVQFYDCQIHINEQKYQVGRMAVSAGSFDGDTLLNYSLSFSSGIQPLKEKLGDDKISDLDFSSVNLVWNLTNIRNIIYGNNDDIVIPLISINRMWNSGYNDTNDIKNGISTGELRPSIRINKILQLIRQKYGIKINIDLGAYNNSFDKLYVWANKEAEDTKSIPLVPVNSYSNQREPFNRPNPDDLFVYPSISNTSFGIKIEETGPEIINCHVDFILRNARNQIDNTPYGGDIKLKMVEVDSTGNQVIRESSIDGALQSNGNILFSANFQNNNRTRYYKMELFPESALVFDNYDVVLSSINSINLNVNDISYKLNRRSVGNPINLINNSFDFSSSFDYKIIDFLSSLVKIFNIKIIEDKNDIYSMTWKNKLHQQELDITKYVDHVDIKSETQTHYKSIKLTHEESDYLRNEAFQNVMGQAYGTEYHVSDNMDLSEEYEIETGINILSYFNLMNTNIITSYGFDSSFKSVDPDSPTLFFRNEVQPLLSFNDSGVQQQVSLKYGNQQMLLSNYTPVSNIDGFTNSTGILSLTFNNEPYAIDNEMETSTLYSNFYNQDFVQLYANNVYINDYKAFLPPHIINKISMENTVIIRDKKFSIYEMAIDANSGKTDFKLINFYKRFENVDDNIIVLPPQLFFVFDFDSTSIQVGWNGSSASPYGVALHRLQWKESSQTSWGLYSMDIPVQANNQVSYIQTITNLYGNTNYDIRIQTVDTQNNWSEWIYLNQSTENVEFITVLPPTHLILETGAFTALHLSWWGAVSQPYPIQSYKVEWRLSNSGQYSQSMTIAGLIDPRFYSITGLQSNKSYDVRVKTIDSQGNESAYITRTFSTQHAFIPYPPGQVGWQVIQPSEDYTNVLFTANFDRVDELESLIEPNIIINLYHLDSGENPVKLLHPIDFETLGKSKKFDFTVWDSDLTLDAETKKTINIKKPSEGEWSIEVGVSSAIDGELSEFTRIENPIRFPLKRQ